MIKRIQLLIVIFLILFASGEHVCSTKIADDSSVNIGYSYQFDTIDVSYVYNITERLSSIIFTEYDEEHGEIAKGRAYGTKGEHKAAEILLENFTQLGLYTYKEQLTNTEDFKDIISNIQIKEYYVKINGVKVHSYISPVWVENAENNFQLNHTYQYTDLKVIKSSINPFIEILNQKITGENEPFLILMEDKAFYPFHPLQSVPFLNNFYFNYYIIRVLQSFPPVLFSSIFDDYSTDCKGIIMYDFNDDTIDMNLFKPYNELPIISINGSNGKKILDDIEHTRIDYLLNQEFNQSVISYNVIGQINGTDPSKTIIVDSLYDSWWNQGTADSAIAMSMVLGIAKYFKEQNIKPKYTLKFIGFSGEEQGLYAGAKHYASTHEDEDIIYIIDLNQIGFKQKNPILGLNIIGNKIKDLIEISSLIKQGDYGYRVNSSTGIKYVWLSRGVVSNPHPFVQTHPNCSSFTFLKDSGWILHHRDGLNHTKGDVLDQFDHEDIKVTGEILLNLIRYLATDWDNQDHHISM